MNQVCILTVDEAAVTLCLTVLTESAPVWSPDGQWIAFRRKTAGTALGKQLWVMRADGDDARALTTGTDAHYGPPVWSADGETLLSAQYVAGVSELWTISTISAPATRSAPEGYLPHRLK